VRLIEKVLDKYLVMLDTKEYSRLKQPSSKLPLTKAELLHFLTPQEARCYCSHIFNLTPKTKVISTSKLKMYHTYRKPHINTMWTESTSYLPYEKSSDVLFIMQNIIVEYGKSWFLADYNGEIDTLLYYCIEDFNVKLR